MFKLRADSPNWAVVESEGDEITAFVSHDETKAQVVFKKDDDPCPFCESLWDCECRYY